MSFPAKTGKSNFPAETAKPIFSSKSKTGFPAKIVNEFLRQNKFFYKIVKSCLYIKTDINDINILYDIFRINKIIFWVPMGKPIPYWVIFWVWISTLMFLGFCRLGINWVGLSVSWAGLDYFTLR